MSLSKQHGLILAVAFYVVNETNGHESQGQYRGYDEGRARAAGKWSKEKKSRPHRRHHDGGRKEKSKAA